MIFKSRKATLAGFCYAAITIAILVYLLVDTPPFARELNRVAICDRVIVAVEPSLRADDRFDGIELFASYDYGIVILGEVETPQDAAALVAWIENTDFGVPVKWESVTIRTPEPGDGTSGVPDRGTRWGSWPDE